MITSMMSSRPAAYHVVAKPTGPICNLDCEYCFSLSKEQFYPGHRFRMTDEMLETYIRQLLESHRTSEVTVAWQGGEPTMMGLDFFRQAREVVDKDERPGPSISIDGPEALHAANQDHPPDVYRIFRDDLGLRFMQFIPVVERTTDASLTITARGWHDANRDTRRLYTQSGNSVTDLGVGPAALGTFLIAILDEWLAHDVGEVSVQHFDGALANWRGEPGAVCAGRARRRHRSCWPLRTPPDTRMWAATTLPRWKREQVHAMSRHPTGRLDRPGSERSRT